jgi:hypothetical protein
MASGKQQWLRDRVLMTFALTTGDENYQGALNISHLSLCLSTYTWNSTLWDGSNMLPGEPNTANGYMRADLAAGDLAIVTENELSNTVEVSFPTATGSWGTINSFYLLAYADPDHRLLYGGDLTIPLDVSTGDTPTFAVGTLVLREV